MRLKVVIQMSKKKRLLKGLWASVACHALIVLALALFGLLAMTIPEDKAIDIVFAEELSAGDAREAVAQQVEERPVHVRQKIMPDDITEKVKEQPVREPSRQNTGKETNKTEGNNTAGGGTGQGSGGNKVKEPVTVNPPVLLNNRKPAYPAGAREANAEGTAYIKVHVATNGAAQSPVIVRSSGRSDFDAAALKEAARWRFSPAKNSLGQSVACDVNIPVVFSLEK